MSSAIGVLQVQSSYDRTSPLNVTLGQISSVGEASFTVENIGGVDVWCRVNNNTSPTYSTSWVRSAPGRQASFSLNGSADQALSLDLYIPAQSHRFIPIHDTSANVPSYIGRVEVTRHGN